MTAQKTTVGMIAEEILTFTAGQDVTLDRELIEWDCIGSAAHVTMLSRISMEPKIISPDECRQVVAELVKIMRCATQGQFEIQLQDQDVHLAVERALTQNLGDLGKKIHTCRSRNDQVAVDLRLYAKRELLTVFDELAALAGELVLFGKKHEDLPMVGRTHMQPGMPSSVGLWATSYTESLLDDAALLISVYGLNDQCPLGSAASYGVPVPIDRKMTSDLLGFSKPIHNVLYANNARGKLESMILSCLSQVMLTLSRFAQDMILFSMPEFGYFKLPADFCTGSSIMPQKQNPDVLELVRAKTSCVLAESLKVAELIKGSPSGYNRDIQEAKGPFMFGIRETRASLRVLSPLVRRIEVDKNALLKGFSPDVFATDRSIRMVCEGTPFRDAYHHVKAHLDELENENPEEALQKKTHYGAPMGLNWREMTDSVEEVMKFARTENQIFNKVISNLLGVTYPFNSL